VNTIVTQFEQEFSDVSLSSRVSELFKRVAVISSEKLSVRRLLARRAMRKTASESPTSEPSYDWQKTLVPGLW